jgi:putative membrane protein
LIGFALPIASVVTHSVSILDFAAWALIAGVIQLLAFVVVNRVIGGAGARIRENDTGTAILLAGVSISIGLMNAACMTPYA